MIVALDFDGTMCDYSFPIIPETLWEDVVDWIKEGIRRGHTIKIYTCRSEEYWPQIKELLNKHGLDLSINDMEDSWGTAKYKMFADIYIDDHSPWFPGRDWIKRTDWFNLEFMVNRRTNI